MTEPLSKEGNPQNEKIKLEKDLTEEKEETKTKETKERKKDIGTDIENSMVTRDSHPLSNPSKKTFTKFAFLIFGIGGLLAWNAILSDLDFFNYYLKEAPVKPDVIYPFMNFALNITFQFILVFNKKIFSYKIQLIVTITLSMLSLVLLPISVLFFSPTVGFYLSCGIVLLQGFFNAVCLSSFFGLVSYFPTENIVMMSTGQGIAGILMNVIKYITLLSLSSFSEKDQNIYGTLIFFSISAVIMLVCLIFVVLAYKNKYFLSILSNTDEKPQDLVSIDDINEKEALVSASEDDTYSERTYPKQAEQKNVSFCEAFKAVLAINLLLFFMYTVTFTLYPAACLTPSLFSLPMNWKPNTVVTIFNVLDTIGRNLLNFIKPRKILLYIFSLGRAIVLITLPLNIYFDTHAGYDKTWCSVFLIINVSILAITNGLCTSLSYALAPMEVEDHMKGKAGSTVSFFNICGIFTGTCVAFGMNAIISAITPQTQN